MRGSWYRWLARSLATTQAPRTAAPGLSVEPLESREVPAYTGTGAGLIANYFSDPGLANLGATRTDAAVDFNWGGAPSAALPADGFSARWTGQVQAQFTEAYTLSVAADEGVRLWVGGQKVIDTWGTRTPGEWSAAVAMKSGEAYDLKLEYADTAAAARVRLAWASPSTPKANVPTSQLYGAGGWLDPDIGGPAVGGSLTGTGGVYTVRGAGALGGTTDQSHFAYQTVSRDGTVGARLDALAGSGAEAGVMFRSGAGATDPFAGLVVSNAQVTFRSRAVAGAAATQSAAVTVGAQPWLKLVRNGPLVSGYVSATGGDGTWQLVGTAAVGLDTAALAGLVSGSAPGSAVGTATFSNVTAAATAPVGANIDGIHDWSLANVFVDIMKQARTFTVPNGSRPAATDASGWPAEDFYAILQSGFLNTAHIYNGVYRLSFTGRADVSMWAGSGSVSNVRYDAATNRTTADVALAASDADGGWYFGLTFRNVGTGVKDIRLIRPGYDANTTQVFTNDFLTTIAPFSTLRTMDFTETNNNAVANWADRAKPTDATQATDKGVAWEYVVQLANQTGKDVWINVPYGATDDYVRQLATLLKSSLNPDRAVYVEWSNELWNGGFSQTQANLQAAVAEVNAGTASGRPSNLYAPGETVQTSQWDWAFRRIARRTVEISNAFASVWGAGATSARVRTVLATQVGVPYIGRSQMEYIDKTFGDPRRFVYGVAGAPYFAVGDADRRTDLTTDQVLAALSSAVDANRSTLDQYAALAAYYRVEFLAYEGGPDTFGPNNVAVKKAASLDPRIQDLTARYMNDWYARGGGLFNWYMAGPTNYDTPYGTWGLTNDITNLGAPKALGIQQVQDAPRVTPTNGAAVAGEVLATNSVGTAPTSDPYPRYLNAGASRDYLVRVPQAGTFELRVRYAEATAGGRLQVLVNDSDVGTLALPVTGPGYDGLWAPNDFADSVAITVRLEEGLNVVRLNVVSPGFTLYSLKFNGIGGAVSPPTVPPTVPPVSPPVTANQAPTVAGSGPTGAVTGTTASLSAVGADDAGEAALRYAWSLVSGPGAVTFSASGTNAAKSAVATFTQAGTYALQVVATDAGGLTASKTVAVSVTQSLAGLILNPGSVTLAAGATQAFVAAAADQFGRAMALPWVGWGTVGGTISAGGVYTTPGGAGSATVTASYGGKTASATVTVTGQAPPAVPPTSPPAVPPTLPPTVPPATNQAPTVTASGPEAITGTVASLSAVGTDDGGEAALRYAWALVSGPAAVVFSANGTNAAKNANATFARAGTYVLRVAATDAAGLTASKTVTVTVGQAFTGLTVTPASVTLKAGRAQQFLAVATDQFGQSMSLPWVGWGTVGGTVSASGLYNAPHKPGTATVYASYGGKTASVTITVTA